MPRRLPQFWSNSTTECTDTVATDDSDNRMCVRNHHDQPHEELSISSLLTVNLSLINYNEGVSLFSACTNDN